MMGEGTDYEESETEYSAPNSESYITHECTNPDMLPCIIVVETSNGTEFIDMDDLASAMEP